MIRLTGLWKNKTKAGEPMMTGSLGNGRLVILPNKFKKGERDPEYTLFLAEKQDGGTPGGGAGTRWRCN